MSRQICLFAALLVAAGLSAGLARRVFPIPGVPISPSEQALEQGLERLLTGDLERGQLELERIPYGSESFLIALDNLSSIDGAFRGPLAARERVASLVELHPQDFELRLRLGALLYESGEFDGAARQAHEATRAAPTHSQPLYALALYQLAGGALAEAIASYQAALQTDPGTRSAPAAVDALRRHVERHPEQIQSHFALAFFCSLQGQTAQEIVELERYLAANPEGATSDAARDRLHTLRTQGRKPRR